MRFRINKSRVLIISGEAAFFGFCVFLLFRLTGIFYDVTSDVLHFDFTRSQFQDGLLFMAVTLMGIALIRDISAESRRSRRRY